MDHRALAALFRNDPDGYRGVRRPRAKLITGAQADLRAPKKCKELADSMAQGEQYTKPNI